MKKCIFCGSNNISAKGQIEGYRRSTFFNVFECDFCHVSGVIPNEMDPSLYEFIYKNSNRVPGYSRYSYLASTIGKVDDPFKFIKYFEENYFAVIQSVSEFLVKCPNAKVAEIGCGQGYLTYALRKQGIDCVGYDLSQTAVDHAKKNFGDFYYCQDITTTDGPGDKFDCLISMELIEHMTDPVKIIEKFRKKLKPNGIIIMTTPQKNPTTTALWKTELPPVHLWWLTKQSITSMADHLGMTVRFFDLTDFYIKSGSRLPTLDDGPHVAKPFFDENYELIEPQTFNGSSVSARFNSKLRSIFRALLGLSQKNIQNLNNNSKSLIFVLNEKHR